MNSTYWLGAYSAVASVVHQASDGTWRKHSARPVLSFPVAFPPSSWHRLGIRGVLLDQTLLDAFASVVRWPGLDEVLVRVPTVVHARARYAACLRHEDFETLPSS
jgi:hypothetical protein